MGLEPAARRRCIFYRICFQGKGKQNRGIAGKLFPGRDVCRELIRTFLYSDNLRSAQWTRCASAFGQWDGGPIASTRHWAPRTVRTKSIGAMTSGRHRKGSARPWLKNRCAWSFFGTNPFRACQQSAPLLCTSGFSRTHGVGAEMMMRTTKLRVLVCAQILRLSCARLHDRTIGMLCIDNNLVLYTAAGICRILPLTNVSLPLLSYKRYKATSAGFQRGHLAAISSRVFAPAQPGSGICLQAWLPFSTDQLQAAFPTRIYRGSKTARLVGSALTVCSSCNISAAVTPFSPVICARARGARL
jgi:hypothetical protein